MDYEAYLAVLQAATGRTDEGFHAIVLKEGMFRLMKPLTDYVTLIANGGRSDVDGEGKGGAKGKPSAS